MGHDLWDSRAKASSALEREASNVRALLEELFGVVDEAAEALHAVDTPFGRVTALLTVKARRLAQGCYSLTLDGLPQEAGVLLRPLIECLELLEYLRSNPDEHAQEAIDNRLPKAGDIAKRIDGQLKDVRDHLNEYASHISVSHESMRHLIRSDAEHGLGELQLQQPFDSAVLLQNLGSLFAAFESVAIQAVSCAVTAQCPTAGDMANHVMGLRDRGYWLFRGPQGGTRA